MLTLENTSETIKRVQTYLDRDMTSSDTPTAVLQAHTSESKTILTLKTELTEIKTVHTKVTRDVISLRGLFLFMKLN